MNSGFSTQELDKKRRNLEMMITEACLRGSDLVPTAEDKVMIQLWGEELFRMSEGKNQVLFDKAGRVHIMVNFFATEEARLDYLSQSNTLFNSADAGLSSVHPAFIVNNAPIRGFRLDKYQWPRVNGKNYCASLYGLPPAWGSGGATMSYDGMHSAVDTVNGAATDPDGIKMHVQTRAEFSYLALLSVAKAFQCRGNTSYGKAHDKTSEVGSPCGYMYNGKPVHTATGTGPITWYSDGTPWGVADLVGNVSEWASGYKTNEGEMYFMPNNDAAETVASEHATGSSKWKALLSDGSFVAPGTEATMKYDYTADPGTANAGKNFELTDTLRFKQTVEAPYGSMALSSIAAHEGVTVPTYLRLMMLFPLLTGTPKGQAYMRNYSVRASLVGGNWGSTSYAGFGCSYGYGTPSYAYDYVGGRSASIIQ